MVKADKNDLIYFKQGCDKTYITSKNANGSGVVQQTLDGSDVFPKTKAKAVIMSDGKTLEEAIQAGGSDKLVRIEDVAIMGSTSLNNTGTCYYGFSFSPSNYNVEIDSIEITSDCSEVVIGYVNSTEFQVNVNAIPATTDHKFTVVVKDKIGMVVTKEFPFYIKQEPTSLSISGSAEVDNESTNNYTISYSPSTYNVAPTSVEITSNQSSVAISNKTKTGFTLTPNCSESLTATITVKATMPSGTVITNTKSVTVNCGPDYDAIDEYGVGIMTVNGKFYLDSASWINAGSPTANGVAVSDGTHRFCIAKDKIKHVCSTNSYSDAEYWGGYGIQVSGVTTVDDLDVARNDFNGVANTDAIVANVCAPDGCFTKTPWSAAGLCRQFIFPDGASGYLGACGEWGLVQNSRSKINTLLSAIGGSKIETSSHPYYWSSTQWGKNYAMVWDFNLAGCTNNNKTYDRRVRAFCAF